MNLDSLINAFVDGASHGDTTSMFISDDELYSYGTAIAKRTFNPQDEGARMFITNDQRYSVTTSKQQNKLRAVLASIGYVPTKIGPNTTEWR